MWNIAAKGLENFISAQGGLAVLISINTQPNDQISILLNTQNRKTENAFDANVG